MTIDDQYLAQIILFTGSFAYVLAIAIPLDCLLHLLELGGLPYLPVKVNFHFGHRNLKRAVFPLVVPHLFEPSHYSLSLYGHKVERNCFNYSNSNFMCSRNHAMKLSLSMVFLILPVSKLNVVIVLVLSCWQYFSM